MREDVVAYLANHATIDSSVELARCHQWDHARLVGVLKSLQSQGMVGLEAFEQEQWKLTEEGESYAARGSPEAQVHAAVAAAGRLSQAALSEAIGPVSKIGFGAAMKLGWVSVDKETKDVIPTSAQISDTTGMLLREVKAVEGLPSAEAEKRINKVDLESLKKRKLSVLSSLTGYRIERLAGFTTEAVKYETDLTPEMLLSGSWKTAQFKPYNLNSLGRDLQGGHLHPLLKVRAEIRKILLYMGFEEMPTNRFVESSFWNFDTLFQPQQHPARDAHDTFFVSEPATTLDFPPSYLEAVKEMHERGGFGSIGWRYDWSVEEASKNILRTHTTAVSARVLYEMGQEYQKTGVFVPRKCFSIDRVFRNETLDATHLAEFHQVEGLVADRGLTLKHLMGEIQEFYRRMGMKDLKFKPAYNPYTEPSMEIFAFHPQLKRWIEVGNSGIFRPEMLRPMGLPEDVSVIAWGLSVERPTMIQYGIPNIRELFGHKMEYSSLKKNPICWFNPVSKEEVVRVE